MMAKKLKPRILILHASAGAGHKQAALSLEKTCQLTSSATAKAIDILDYTPAYFKRWYTHGYLEVIKNVPELWGYLYDHSYEYTKTTVLERIHKVISHLHLGPLLDYVQKFDPDALVFTHFLGAELLHNLRRKKILHIPFFCVVTDFAVHSIWISKRYNAYYVATEGEKRVLKRHGFKDNQIKVTGIPVNPVFASPVDKNALCRKRRLNPNLPIVLMISGRYNLRGYENLLSSFKNIKERLQLIVLAGRHKGLLQKLRKIAKGLKMPVSIDGIVDNMHELMSISDIVITKPGGLTTSEALAAKTLMAVIDPIPGQEQRNTDFLLESGVAIRIHDMKNGGQKIAALLYNKKRLSDMQTRLKLVSNPHASYDIVQDIIHTLR